MMQQRPTSLIYLEDFPFTRDHLKHYFIRPTRDNLERPFTMPTRDHLQLFLPVWQCPVRTNSIL